MQILGQAFIWTLGDDLMLAAYLIQTADPEKGVRIIMCIFQTNCKKEPRHHQERNSRNPDKRKIEHGASRFLGAVFL
ncbi:hypothetical protein G7K_5348-t1 [Saitoella complicata NRRL Y-17804]|uniref:Uncharacterized protein n=1 Tax=Saitoella complicata (strain BCRC 22490 / CBS 7301 / JCM 7358 / NBRC 10748 / NRRL Y-17804) TaxID=698492 RepID=A0A0E9NP85_SAICN|nr:hypothetical protein G7K_5348-t1 [Saitoella complicata NRRL Y-17804]